MEKKGQPIHQQIHHHHHLRRRERRGCEEEPAKSAMLHKTCALAVVRNRTLDNEKTPPPSPPAQRGLTERQKKAEELKARNEARVVADLKARLVVEVAPLKASLGRQKKRKASSSGEAANPKQRRQKLSN